MWLHLHFQVILSYYDSEYHDGSPLPLPPPFVSELMFNDSYVASMSHSVAHWQAWLVAPVLRAHRALRELLGRRDRQVKFVWL